MKTVIVHGIHSLNVGDDLFFHILSDRYPNTRFVLVASKKYKQTFGKDWRGIIVTERNLFYKLSSLFGKVLRIPSTALLYIWLLIRYRVNLFLIVGGSLFMEGKSRMPTFIEGVSRMRRFRPKMKIAILGSNFGPCETVQWRQKVEKSLKLVDDVCFRDRASYLEFAHLPNIRWGNDIVMHLAPHGQKERTKSVCVNIRSVDNWPSLKPYKYNYLNTVCSLINHYKAKGYSIKLISFCQEYGDNEITKELLGLLGNKENVEVYFYNGDINRVLNLISESEIMIGTRFHAIVLGLVYNLNVLPVSYSIKTENMLKTYNLWNGLYDFGSFCTSTIRDLTRVIINDYKVDVNHNTMFNYTDSVIE